MSVSVVIPLYNKAPHIERTLQSVLMQTSLPDEIIVVDDGSTDGGGEIVASLGDPRIRLITQENRGESAARNRGITEAKGDLIAFLDADDAWRPPFLETINYLRKKYSNAGAYATAYDIVGPQGEKRILKFNALPNDLPDGLITDYVKRRVEASYLPDPLCSSSTAIPKDVCLTIKGFAVNAYLGADIDAWLKIALRYPLAWSREPLAIYYQNATNRIYGFQKWNAEPEISQTARQALQSNLISEDLKPYLREYAARFQLIAARNCLTSGHKDVASQMLSLARGTRMFARDWWRCRLMAALPGKSVHYLWKMKKFLNRQAH
jgi:glycosyltransferase involved in cell wall biosynthesis